MSSEAELVISVWDAVRENVPVAKRNDLAKELLYAFKDFGFTESELADIVDEDTDLSDAFDEVFEALDEEEESEDYD